MHRLAAVVFLASLGMVAPRPADAAPTERTAPVVRCGTSDHLAAARLVERPPRVYLGGGGEKVTRDGFGGGHQVLESANFAVKWTSQGIDQDDAESALDALEDSWAFYFDVLGHTPPPGSETTRGTPTWSSASICTSDRVATTRGATS